MKNKIAIGCLLVILSVLCAVGIKWEWTEWKNEHARLVQFMEERDDFTPEEVDMLWRFKTYNQVDQKYMDLYNKKVKHLPGWTP